MPILGIMASAMSANLWQPEGAYDSLATVTVPSGGLASVTFAGIPAGYRHLQIRISSRGTTAANYVETKMNFNSDTGSNYYANHQLLGNGSAASASADATATYASAHYSVADSNTASVYTGAVIDILDYASTSKNKTIRNISGTDSNGAGFLVYRSALWKPSTIAAISSIDIAPISGNWKQDSNFALYGIR